MFESGAQPPEGSSTTSVGRLDSASLRSWLRRLSQPGALDRDVDDAERIEHLRLLEQLKSAAAAAQAEVTVEFAASQRAEQAAAGLPRERLGQGVAAQVALARRESPHRGGQHLGLAQALVRELPGTLAELRAGRTSEWRATVVARETACLDPEARRLADAELAPQLADLGDRQTEAAARRVAYRLDPHAFTARTRGAVADRRVTLRPAPDTMSRLTGLLPVAHGVAAYAALAREADRLRAEGDPRSRGQIMADILVARVTGQKTADAVPVEVHLVMSTDTLLDPESSGRDEPALLVGAGPVAAPVARAMVRDAAAQVYLRRLFTRPGDGALVAMESRRRPFPEPLRRLLVVRDQVCRTSWCSAPVRHADHVVRAAAGGPTSAANGQGLCEACNYAREAPGWRALPGPDPELGAGQEVEVTTPTGHRYRSRPPPLPGGRHAPPSLMERYLGQFLAAA